MATTSVNGWPVLTSSDQCKKWVIPFPAGGQSRHLILAPGAPGFVLAHFALWFHAVIEPLNAGTWDDWGWANRNIRGSSSISNHASGTAIDLNATKHPMGVSGTFTAWQKFRIKTKLRTFYGGVIVWGDDWSRPDGMHFEIAAPRGKVRRVYRRLRWTQGGRLLHRANT